MSRYEKNEIMKLIGKQIPDKIVEQGDIPAIEAIWSANLNSDSKSSFFDLLVDVFIYGYIRGKQAERQKKKAPL